MDEQQKKDDDNKAMEPLTALKAMAVRQATLEVVSENRDEIVKRARAKLVAMGVPFSEAEGL